MKKISLFSSNVCLGLGTAAACVIWQYGLAPALDLMSWAGFAGCTCYFACPDKGMKGVKSGLICAGSGIAYAYLSMFIGSRISLPAAGVCAAFIITHLMCVQSAIPALSYIPGTFFGSFSTFAAGGDKRIIPCMIIGLFLGLCCDKLGKLLFLWFGKDET